MSQAFKCMSLLSVGISGAYLIYRSDRRRKIETGDETSLRFLDNPVVSRAIDALVVATMVSTTAMVITDQISENSEA